MKLEVFKDLIQRNRFPASVILEGSGRHDWLQKCVPLLFCETHEACGECAGCKKVAKKFHPDWVTLPEDYKLEDLRKALLSLRQKPFESRYRLLIIPDLRSNQVALQNALLKTLEEPLAGWILILGVESRSALLPTVRSRCLLIPATSGERESLSGAELEIFEAVESADEFRLFEKLEPFLKDREKSKSLWKALLSEASFRKNPGHWLQLAPALEESLLELDRNLHQKLLWDRVWVSSLSSAASA